MPIIKKWLQSENCPCKTGGFTQKLKFRPGLSSNLYQGAFIIHSLRYYIGDEVFFPMLRAFASMNVLLMKTWSKRLISPNCTALYRIGFAGITMYLKIIRVPKVKVSKKGKNGYQVSLPSIDFSMPVEIKTSNGYERHILSSKPVLVRSAGSIEVDPKGWYLLYQK